MQIYKKIVWDIDGVIIESDSYEYVGPLAICDRSLVDRSKSAMDTATGAAANYGAAGAAVQANLVPRLEQQAVNPEGYGAIGLGDMETAAQQTAAGATGSAQEAARLRAMRTSNAAGVGAAQVAMAGEGARAQGGALQSILAKNAQLKAQQQQQANTGLEGILGEDIKGQTENAGLVPKDIEAAIKSKDVGWIQDWNAINQDIGGSMEDAAMVGKGK